MDDDEESDELDDLDDPRIEELATDDEEGAPKLAKTDGKDGKKGKNKRAADDDEPASLDDIMAKSLKPAANASPVNGEQKLSKKQLKKLKNNAGNAVAAASDDAKDSSSGSKDKKVQFAKELEQGPNGKQAKDAKDTPDTKGKQDAKPANADPNKPSLGVKVVQGVTIDDKKLGTGPVAKKGNKVEMRYVGKLQSNLKQFDGKSFRTLLFVFLRSFSVLTQNNV